MKKRDRIKFLIEEVLSLMKIEQVRGELGLNTNEINGRLKLYLNELNTLRNA